MSADMEKILEAVQKSADTTADELKTFGKTLEDIKLDLSSTMTDLQRHKADDLKVHTTVDSQGVAIQEIRDKLLKREVQDDMREKQALSASADAEKWDGRKWAVAMAIAAVFLSSIGGNIYQVLVKGEAPPPDASETAHEERD